MLLEILTSYCVANPDIRFGQALWNLGIIQGEYIGSTDVLAANKGWSTGRIIDPYYEEPWDTLKRISPNHPFNLHGEVQEQSKEGIQVGLGDNL